MGASSGEATSRTAIPRQHGKGETHIEVSSVFSDSVCASLSYLNCEHDIARTYAGVIYVEPESLKAFIYYVLCGHLCAAPAAARRACAAGLGGGLHYPLANVNKVL